MIRSGEVPAGISIRAKCTLTPSGTICGYHASTTMLTLGTITPSRTSPVIAVPPSFLASHEHHRRRADKQPEGYKVIPADRLLQHHQREDRENSEGYHLLHDLELGRGELILKIPDPIRRHGDSVFKKRNEPTNRDCLPKRHVRVKQVPIPCDVE